MVLHRIPSISPVILHPSSVLIYSLIDGIKAKSGVEQELKLHLTNEENYNEDEFNEAFEQLVELGVVEKIFKENESLPFISVALRNFWKGFDESNNYFLMSLTKHFTPVITNAQIEEPDVIFIKDSSGLQDYNCSSQNAISFGVFTEEEQSENNAYDFEISTFNTQKRLNAHYLPIWAVHFNWNTNRWNAAPEAHINRIEGFSPTSLGDAIYDFLGNLYKEPSIIPNENYWLQKEENLGRISDFSKIEKGKLTVGMATYDDYNGVYFTLQTIRLYHREVLDKLKFIVLDNNPGGPVGNTLKELQNSIPNYRYLPFEDFRGTTVKDIFFREADTEYVMSIDSHVLLMEGALEKLINYLDERPDCLDLLQGPMLYDDLNISNTYSSSFRPEWGTGMYGAWVKDVEAKDVNGEPFEIPMQGCGLFACRKEAWVGFNPRFRGFAGEEGYIHEKFRQLGRKTICLPFLRWLHRFGRPDGIEYPNLWEDRVRNYFISFSEIGWDSAPISYHFTQHLGKELYTRILHGVTTELQNPMYFFDAVYLTLPKDDQETRDKIEEQLRSINSMNLIRYHSYVKENEDVDYDKICQEIVDKAIKYGLKNVLIIEDRAILNAEFIDHIAGILENANERSWSSLYIGSDVQGNFMSLFHDSMYISGISKPHNCFVYGYNLEYIYALAAELKKSMDKVSLRKMKISYAAIS